jgi:hypothetical protein
MKSLFIVALATLSTSIYASELSNFERGFNEGRETCQNQVVENRTYRCEVEFKNPYSGWERAIATGNSLAEAKVNLIEECDRSHKAGATRCAINVARRKVNCR